MSEPTPLLAEPPMHSPALPPLRDLVLELRRRQYRLGTPAEQPDDFESVLTLAHTVNNALTAICLVESVNRPNLLSAKDIIREAIRRALA